MVVSGSVQQIGRKNLLTLNVHSSMTGANSIWIRSMDYADALELWVKLPAATGYIFEKENGLRRLRQLSYSLFGVADGSQAARAAESGNILGADNYNPINAVPPRPVPANFIKLDRISTQRGEPSGGFYIGTAPVTQREYENIMKNNPSAQKNPNNPVTNISPRDAMVFCNLISIRDGLEPAYAIGWTSSDIDLNIFASGYRLPTTQEFLYARGKIEGMGDPRELVYDGRFVFSTGQPALERYTASPSYVKQIDSSSDGITSYNILPPTEAGSNQYGNPTFRLVRPILDYWKYTSGDQVIVRTEVY
jgi:hypothetical protein